jgi:hypothetical protein
MRWAGQSEEQLQQTIVEALRLAGFTVLSTSRRRKRCRRCGCWPAGGDGVSKGLPDLLIWCPRRRGWIGAEVKGARTKISPEQRALAEAGKVVLVRTVEEALRCAGAGDRVEIGPGVKLPPGAVARHQRLHPEHRHKEDRR